MRINYNKYNSWKFELIKYIIAIIAKPMEIMMSWSTLNVG